MRANGIAEFKFDGDRLEWKFADGRAVTFLISAMPEYQSADDFARAMLLNGAKQKIADAGALSAGSSVHDKFDAMAACSDRLRDRTWNAERVGGGNALPLFDVLRHYYPADKKTDQQIRDGIEALSSADRRKMYYADRVKKSRLHVEAERAKAIKGGDAMLDQFEAA